MKRKREYFRIRRYARRYDKREGKFIINISYETATSITERTVNVAEAFGLGVDRHEKFVIYDHAQFRIGPSDVVYITGDSGSGKSVLLHQMKKDLGNEAIDMADLRLEPEKPIIDTVGETFSEALELLSKAGLNDAFLFVRRFKELSEGQKYRYKIAKLMESGKQWWLADEFCSTLDRDTAKIVAFNLQKLARRNRKAVVVATTHTDLLEDLKPNVHIHKRFGKEVTVKYYEPKKDFTPECSLLKEITLQEGTISDYYELAGFHYRSHRLPPPRKIFRATRNNETVGVIVYSYPSPIAFGRKKAGLNKTSFHELNKTLSTISRVIVHPKYRSIGLGQKLVRETLHLSPTPMVETMAVMARYNPFFEKAGMHKICEQPPSKQAIEIESHLPGFGFNLQRIGSVHYNLSVLKTLSKRQLSALKKVFAENAHPRLMKHFLHRKPFGKKGDYVKAVMDANLEKLAGLIKAVALLCQVKVYLFWEKRNGKAVGTCRCDRYVAEK
jgi:ABC-type lipoprotein export system ATPase subunit/GNAT superfamily N-acetyltransferase